MRFGNGCYAVIEHGGDELSDWQHIKAVLPTRRAALAYARREVGSFSLDDALQQRRRWNEAHPHPLDQRRTHQWATMHALSPELAAQYRRDPQSLRASSIIDEYAQHPHYQARGERVFCTFAEADDYAERPRRRQAPPPFKVGRRSSLLRCQIVARCVMSVDWVA
jgi:hypothetical protein